MELLAQSGETLAGRITFAELTPFDATEVGADPLDRLWVRGGFPESFLARGPGPSLRWRRDFIRTYLERDIPQLGPRIPAETLRRLWTMLAHNQGGLLNAANLARGLFYRTSGEAEIDLVLTWPDERECAIEVKRTLAPRIERGLRSALADIAPERGFVVYPGEERYPLGSDVEAISLPDLCAEFSSK